MTPVASDSHRDQALLHRIAGGDASALGELYDRHASAILGLLCRVLRDRSEAEDVLQEVFVRVWERAGTYDPSLGVPGAWLSRIARNRAIDRLRARAGRPEFADCGCAEVQTSASGEATPEAVAFRAEQQRLVLLALDSLTPDQRRLIEHAYYLGYTQSELAAHFRLPLGTVKTRIRAGMMTLRQHLEAAGTTWAPSQPI